MITNEEKAKLEEKYQAEAAPGDEDRKLWILISNRAKLRWQYAESVIINIDKEEEQWKKAIKKK